MIRYLIIDDEPIAHEVIKGYARHLPSLQLQKSCFDAFEALEYLASHTVDLIFLDLNMPRLKGFEFLKTLPDPPGVIVTTAYSEHALEGYERGIVDYLLKPFSLERFLTAVNKATRDHFSDSAAPRSDPAAEPGLFLKTDKQHVQVRIADIRFLEAAGNYVRVVTPGETFTVRDSLSDLQAQLPSDRFVQVHRSFVVSIAHIERIEGNRILLSGHEVPVGKVYRTNVDRLLE